MAKSLTRSLLVLAFLLPMVAFAQQRAAAKLDIPAGNLVTALDTLAHQTGMQFVYSTAQLQRLHTRGVHGQLSAQQALDRLLAGTGYRARQDASGAMVIVRDPAQQAPSSTSAPPPQAPPASKQPKSETLTPIVVLGSRIPRIQLEGPSPVVTITAEQIRQRGFTTVASALQSLTEYLGDTENLQYSTNGTPGASAVDLRGLGPGHTLVLINGQRIADYPQAYGYRINFVDTSQIPLGMVKEIQILSGSASAVYGADAMAGVVDIILKDHAKGVNVRYTVGATQHGGYGSQKLSLSGGFSKGKLSGVFGLDLNDQKPLWASQRSYTDSRLDSPGANSKTPPDDNFRLISGGHYVDPGEATCEKIPFGDNAGPLIDYEHRYCGSFDEGFRTIFSGRRQANLFASANYHFNAYNDFFLTLLGGTSDRMVYADPGEWETCTIVDNRCQQQDFYNLATGKVEFWGRHFTVAENGGLNRGESQIINNTLAVNTGFRGYIGGSDSNWHYDFDIDFATSGLEQKRQDILDANAQAFFLGPQLGTTSSGYPIFDAPQSRLFTPLTPAQFGSISAYSTDHDKSRYDDAMLVLTNANLFNLPAGPLGVAVVGEVGGSRFQAIADPRALDGEFYEHTGNQAVGSRRHQALGYEFSVPVFKGLTVTTAGRYDRYMYGGTTAGKFTFSLGFTYRPFTSLLLRGSLNTGFKPPDLNHVFETLSGENSGGVDYYLCRKNQPNTYPDFEDNCTWGDSNFRLLSEGSPALQDETSKSFTYGFVWQPLHNFDADVDYYYINIKNEVAEESLTTILQDEASCRLGTTLDGTPVDGSSAYCQQIESQVMRFPLSSLSTPGQIATVLRFPINESLNMTSGIDATVNYKVPTERLGTFSFRFRVTFVNKNVTQVAPGAPPSNSIMRITFLPRDRSNLSIGWNYHRFDSTLFISRLSGIPDLRETERLPPTYLANLSLGYTFSPDLQVQLAVNNLMDDKPQLPQDWTEWPYYDDSWFSPVGRQYFLSLDMHFGPH